MNRDPVEKNPTVTTGLNSETMPTVLFNIQNTLSLSRIIQFCALHGMLRFKESSDHYLVIHVSQGKHAPPENA